MIEADQGGCYPFHAATATECDNKQRGTSACKESRVQWPVDFGFRLVIFVLNLPDGQVNFMGKFKLQTDCNQSC